MEAKVEKDYINVLRHGVIEGELVIEVNCDDYDHFRSLPAAVTFQNVLLGKTGWNSDRGYACYKQGAPLAKAVKR